MAAEQGSVGTGFPSGVVTFLFTDIEGSTATLRALREGYADALATHRRLLRDAFVPFGGVEVDTQGDAFFFAFGRASDGLRAAVAGQRALAAHDWPDEGTIKVRMGLHAGEATVTDEGYVGLAVHHAARVAGAAHGEQVVLTDALWQLARDTAADHGIGVRDLGRHALKDIPDGEHLLQATHPSLRTDFPPPRTLTTRRTNLPTQRGSLVGREAQVAALLDLLVQPGIQLVTVTGPGGVGKSRVALEASSRLTDDLPGGVWMVPLADVTDPALVASAIAGTLGIEEDSGTGLDDRLAEALADQRVLLVLDSFERVGEAAETVARLVERCPDMRIVVTSRARLNVRGEQEFPVDPLPIPDPNSADAASSAVVALFTDRARAARPDFDPSEHVSDIVEICAALDGLPLAVELAAARIRILPPKALLQRLSKRLQVVSGGARDAHARQRSLADTIAWSYELLEEEDRRAFERFAVFAGGFTFESAEAVCNPDGAIDVFGSIESLVDKSLLRQTDDEDGEPRFAMLGTVREYALGRLEAGEGSGRHFEQLVAHMADVVTPSATQPTARFLDTIEREYPNARHALEWAIDHAHGATYNLASLLFRYWSTRKLFTEGRMWTLRALGVMQDPFERADLQSSAAMFSLRQGDPGAAVELASAAVASGALDDDPELAAALNVLGSAEYHLGRLDEAAATLDRALDAAHAHGQVDLAAEIAGNRGVLAFRRGDLESAATSFRTVLETLGPDKPRLRAEVENNLGAVLIELGHLDEAAGHLESSLRERRTWRDQHGVGESLTNLGALAQMQGDLQTALDYYLEALPIRREAADLEGVCMVLSNLGEVSVDLGDPEAARRYLTESLEVAEAAGDVHGRAYAAIKRAELALATGEAAPVAERLVTAARSAATACGDKRYMSAALVVSSKLALAAGKASEAADHAREAVDIARSAAASGELLQALLALTEAGFGLSASDEADVLAEAGRLAAALGDDAAAARVASIESTRTS